MKQAIDILNKIKTLDESIIGRLAMSLKLVEVKKNKYLFTAGRPFKDIYIVESGLLGVCYKGRHETVFTSFRTAGDIVIYDKYFYSTPLSHNSILALEESIIYSLSYQTCKNICDDFPDFNFHIRILVQKTVDIIEDYSIITRTPLIRRRYEQFASTYADIFPKIPTKYLASYLNTSVKSLQRVRKELRLRRFAVLPIA
jgi:CRP-like cAMP-binding protein